jgi:sulfoquinovosyltransferase
VSYHTHIPEYIKSYTWQGLAAPMWALIRFWSRAADVMLVTSSVMAAELTRQQCRGSAICLWRRGVDVDIFNPSFRSAEARAALSAGDVEAPLLVYVGRLGAEKNLAVLKGALRVRCAAFAMALGLTSRRPLPFP